MQNTFVKKGVQVEEELIHVEMIRQDFPILQKVFYSENSTKPLIYLDNSATSQKPKQVIEAMRNYYYEINANVHRGIHKLGEAATAAFENSRKKVAEFINAESANEIIFTRGTTEAINLVASGWGRKFLRKNDELLITEMEHHSNLIPWQLLAASTGVRLKFIPFLEDGTLDFSRIEHLLGKDTKLVALTHMSNVFGTINPVRGIIQRAHNLGIPVLLDAAQSVPHLPVDVQDIDVDFLAFSGHKMCGPTGIGALYGKANLLEKMDPYQGGGEMISSVWLEEATYNEIPHKFEAGTPNIAGAIAFGEAIDYLSKIGMRNITRYEQKLTTYALKEIKKIKGLRLFGEAPERGGVISFYLGNIHPHDLAQFLDNEGIAIRAGHHCAQPVMRKLKIPATARASLYFYNTFDEIDKFIDGLKKAQEFFDNGI
jgi:cysteine desulfurase/selenocysteine lyase